MSIGILVTVLCRADVLPLVQALAPGAVCQELPEKDGCLLPQAAGVAASALAGASSAIVGCGLGRTDDLLPLLSAFRQAACPVVWDADALNLLASCPALLPLPVHAVITPHPGEAARLLNLSAPQITADAPAALSILQARCGCHVLLKGARTLMTDGYITAVNPIGTPALARGGSGDVLSGLLGALLARARLAPGQTILETMQLAVYLHARAAIDAASHYGEDCMPIEALVDFIRLRP